MKRKSALTRIFAVSLLVLASLGSNSCKKPTDGLNIIISTQISEATVSVQFIDAKTGEQIGFNNASEKVTVSIEGDDKALITDNAGGSNIQSNNGFLALAVKEGVVPTAANPVEFHLVARANGYVSTALPVTFRSKGTQHHIVYMVKVSNTPPGVGAIVNSSLTADASGATTTAMTLTTPVLTTGFENTQATMVVPAGTVLLDENFQPVTGTITTTFVYFNNQDESSLRAFPAGYNADNGSGNDVFKTGGYVSIVMKNGGGKEVKNFGSAIQTTIQVPAGSTDAQGTPVAAGVTLPVWSYDEESGMWVSESQPMVTLNGTSGKLEVTFNQIHLSYWNLHWKNNNTCATGATVTVSNGAEAPSNCIGILYYADGTFFRNVTFNTQTGSTLALDNTPSGQALILKLFKNQCDYESHTSFATLNIADPCSGNYTMNLSGQSANPTVSVTINATCADRPDRIIRPTLFVYAREAGSCGTNVWEFIGEMVDGKISTSALAQGKTYQIGTMFGDEWKVAPDTYTISETEYLIEQTLPLDICALLDQ